MYYKNLLFLCKCQEDGRAEEVSRTIFFNSIKHYRR